jgi:hypothetical protein
MILFYDNPFFLVPWCLKPISGPWEYTDGFLKVIMMASKESPSVIVPMESNMYAGDDFRVLQFVYS